MLNVQAHALAGRVERELSEHSLGFDAVELKLSSSDV